MGRAQLYSVGSAVVNVCQYHPLGAYWRQLFCDASARIGLQLLELDAFCSDECWYNGRLPSAGARAAGATTLAAGVAVGDGDGNPDDVDTTFELCVPINATVDHSDYIAHVVGQHVMERALASTTVFSQAAGMFPTSFGR